LRMRACTSRPVREFLPGVRPTLSKRALFFLGALPDLLDEPLAVLALCPPRAFEALPPDFALLALPLPLEAALLILDAAPAPPAPSNITLIWLGIARIPNALKRFCTARLVKRVAGMH